MKPRISALLALASLLAGCGFTDASNRTGGDFLASQGFSIEGRDTATTRLASLLPAEVVPVEGIPAPNGIGGLWSGGVGTDSIRAVVAFSLYGASGADAVLSSLRSSGALRDTLTRFHFGLDTAGVADTTLPLRLRARFFLIDSVSSADRGRVGALLAGRDPDDLGLVPAREVDSTFRASALGGIPLGASLRARLAAMLGSSSRHGWLVAVVDGHPGTDVYQIADPVLRNDSVAGFYAPATFQDRPAWRSSQMRGSGSPAISMGWWVDGGRRLRLKLDAQAIRQLLHARLGAGSASDSFDNSFNILSARVRAPFRSFVKTRNSSDDRGIAFAGAVVEQEGRGTVVSLPSAGTATLPIDLGSGYRTRLSLSVDPMVRCDDTTFPGSGVLRCQYLQEGGIGALPTRLSLGYGSYSLYTASEFWVRSDVPDSLEFRIASVVRVRVSTSGHRLNLRWSMLQASPVADAQTGIDSTRPQSRLRASSGSVVRQEIRSAISSAVVQRKLSVDLDLVPGGGSTTMRDLWEAVPMDPLSVVDTLGLVVRPRGGAF